MNGDQLIVSVSGLRGIVGKALTPDVAVRFATACAEKLPAGPILVSRDGRGSGQWLSRLLEGTLSALGRPVISAGVLATPTVGVLVRHWELAGALQVTASHNPAPYNGIKVFDGIGRVVPAELGGEIAHLFRQNPHGPDWANADRCGPFIQPENAIRVHLERVLDTVDVDRIRRRRFRVLLDSNHGAGSLLGVPLLESLGCQVVLLGGTPDGRFEHAPEPTQENLAGVGQAVVEAQADVGFCQDPDADRLAILDERGRYIGEEYTVALCVARRLQQTIASVSQPPAVVINLATSRMTEDLCHQYGARCIRTPVGEAHVVAAMMAHDALYGGEGNGGPIDPRVGWVRDSFAGMAQVLDYLAAEEKPLSHIVNSFPRYTICKTKVENVSPVAFKNSVTALRDDFADAHNVDTRDGIRWEWQDRWLLVRSSNTEPIVRIIAEAPTGDIAAALCKKASDRIAAYCGAAEESIS